MKEFNLRELTKRGCIRTEEKDFRDDGTKFKTLDYKGMEITYTKYEGEYFLSIRVNYYSRGLEYTDIPNEVFKAADEFNGCYEIDPDKVISNAEYIIQELNRIQNEVAKELEVKPDTTSLKERSLKEIEMGTKAIEDFKKSEVIYNIKSEYEIKWALDYLHSLEDEVKDLVEMDWEKLSNQEIRSKLIHLKEDKYIRIENDNFYIKKLNNYIKKYK